jgi:hypothetical protein
MQTPRYGLILSGIPGQRRRRCEAEQYSNSVSRRPDAGAGGEAACGPGEYLFFRESGGAPPREADAAPEREKEYPEPSMFGMLPAYGIFIRHATGIEFGPRFATGAGHAPGQDGTERDVKIAGESACPAWLRDFNVVMIRWR